MDKNKKIYLKELLPHFWKALKPNKWVFFVNYFSSISANLLVLAVPLFYKKFFDILGQNTDKKILLIDLLHIIIIIAIIHLIIWLFWRTLDFSGTFMMSNTLSRLRQNSFEYILRHSYTFFTNNFTGGIVQKVNRFTRSFETLQNSMIYQIIPITIAIIGSIIITYTITPVIALVMIIWIILFTSFSVFILRWKLKYDTAAAESDSLTTGYLADNITNHSAISLFSRHLFESLSFKKISNEQARKTRLSWYISDTIDSVQSLLIYIVEFFIFYYTLLNWSDGLATIGTFVLVQTYIIGIANQFWGLNRTIRSMYQAVADAKEMVEILETPYDIRDIPGAKNLQIKNGSIKFKDVRFNFDENRLVLNNLNIHIKNGEKVAMVGPSGAGKTTFVRLIMRFYDVTGGVIEIDDQNISGITQDSLRENISFVPQDPILFHRTLMENIRYGKIDATDEEVREAARLAYCDDFIENLPLKYETYVGERGIKLSGGERQRVAIARAILKKAPILILDEATSSLDSHSEKLIQDALDNLMKNCTTIVIAHRLSTIKKMDRIIAMKDGVIIEDGSHTELTNKKGGLYKDLWELQAGGFIQK